MLKLIRLRRKKIFLFIQSIHTFTTTAGWLVTKVCKHYTFEYAPFKKEFVTVNRNARQKKESSVEMDF